MRKAILMMLLATLCSSTAAGQFSYFCTVQSVYQIDGKGQIEKSSNIWLTDLMRGQRFSVDRRNGNVAGEHVPAFRPDKFVVLFPGGDGNAFKSYFQGGNFVGFLEIYEYTDGKKKPYVLHDGASIYSGICE